MRKNESSLVSGSITISRAGSVPGYGTGDGHRKTAAGSTMTAMEIKYIMNGKGADGQWRYLNGEGYIL